VVEIFFAENEWFGSAAFGAWDGVHSASEGLLARACIEVHHIALLVGDDRHTIQRVVAALLTELAKRVFRHGKAALALQRILTNAPNHHALHTHHMQSHLHQHVLHRKIRGHTCHLHPIVYRGHVLGLLLVQLGSEVVRGQPVSLIVHVVFVVGILFLFG